MNAMNTTADETNKLLFRANPLPIIIYEIGSLAIIDVNEMACKLYGYTADEFTRLTIKDISATEDETLTTAVVNPDTTGEINNLGTWKHLKNNGDIIKVELIGNAVNYMDKY